jgi:hypothetical protein
MTVRLERETYGNNGHQNVHSSTDVNWNIRIRIRIRRHNSRHYTHDAITGNGHTVASCTMRRWHYSWCIRVQGTVVDVETEVDCVGESERLVVVLHLAVREKE